MPKKTSPCQEPGHHSKPQPTDCRGVFPTNYHRKVLFSKTVIFKTPDLPRWKPKNIIGLRTFEDKDLWGMVRDHRSRHISHTGRFSLWLASSAILSSLSAKAAWTFQISSPPALSGTSVTGICKVFYACRPSYPCRKEVANLGPKSATSGKAGALIMNRSKQY
jgi:hypothetical protein